MMQKQVERVQKFLYGWLVEPGPDGALAPSRVASLYGLCFALNYPRDEAGAWRNLNALENAVEAWAIELDVSTTPVDDAHPDSPMADNIIRKLMVIRGTTRAV